jgi:hypothetical protein
MCRNQWLNDKKGPVIHKGLTEELMTANNLGKSLWNGFKDRSA